jgi:hypothetical protein
MTLQKTPSGWSHEAANRQFTASGSMMAAVAVVFVRAEG